MHTALSTPMPLPQVSTQAPSRALKVAAVVAVHVLALSWFARQAPTPLAASQPRTIYASVINEPVPAPAAAPQPPAAPTPPPPPPTPVARPVPKPVAKATPAPRHVAVPVSTPAPAVAATPAPAAAPVVAAAPTPPPAPPKTITHGVEYLRAPEPQYPDRDREDGNEGTVVLRVLVDESGKPGHIDVLRSSGFGSLDEAGRAAARAALFKPYREDGRAMSVYVIVPLRFQLDS